MGDNIDVLKPNNELFLLYTGDHIIYNTQLSDPLNSTIAINQAQSCIQTLYKPAVSPSLSSTFSSLIYDDASNQTKCLDIDNYLTSMYVTRTQANELMGTILFSYNS